MLAIDQLHCLSQPGIAFKARHVRRPQPVRKGPRRASGCSPAPVLKCDQSRTARSHCVSPVTVYMRAHAFLSTFDGYPRTVNSRSLWHKLYVPPILSITRHMCYFLQASNDHPHLLPFRAEAIVSLISPDCRCLLPAFIQVLESMPKFPVVSELDLCFKKAICIRRCFEFVCDTTRNL